MKKRRIFFIVGVLISILFIIYFIDRNRIENTIIIDNQTSTNTPEIIFYLTQSNSADSQVIKGQKFGEVSSVPPKKTNVAISEIGITEDSNVVFEYIDYNGNVVTEYINDYIPINSRKYNMELTLLEIDNEGRFKYK